MGHLLVVIQISFIRVLFVSLITLELALVFEVFVLRRIYSFSPVPRAVLLDHNYTLTLKLKKVLVSFLPTSRASKKRWKCDVMQFLHVPF